MSARYKGGPPPDLDALYEGVCRNPDCGEDAEGEFCSEDCRIEVALAIETSAPTPGVEESPE